MKENSISSNFINFRTPAPKSKLHLSTTIVKVSLGEFKKKGGAGGEGVEPLISKQDGNSKTILAFKLKQLCQYWDHFFSHSQVVLL